jgi:hypothetical protein
MAVDYRVGKIQFSGRRAIAMSRRLREFAKLVRPNAPRRAISVAERRRPWRRLRRRPAHWGGIVRQIPEDISQVARMVIASRTRT